MHACAPSFIDNYFLLSSKASSSDNDSGSAGAAIGGAVGGAAFFIIIIVLVVLSVLLYIKHSKSTKSYTISTEAFPRPDQGTFGSSLFSSYVIWLFDYYDYLFAIVTSFIG